MLLLLCGCCCVVFVVRLLWSVDVVKIFLLWIYCYSCKKVVVFKKNVVVDVEKFL